jgi:hypothetical protein
VSKAMIDLKDLKEPLIQSKSDSVVESTQTPDSETKPKQKRRARTYNAVFNVTNSIIGGGVLALPQSMKLSGLIIGNLWILVAAGVEIYSAILLIFVSQYAFGGGLKKCVFLFFSNSDIHLYFQQVRTEILENSFLESLDKSSLRLS